MSDCSCSTGSCSTTELRKENETSFLREYFTVIFSFTMLIAGIALEHIFKLEFFNKNIALIWYILAYLPVAFPVLKSSWETIKKGNVFNEFFLMSIATIGAFIIGEYPEAVGVMLFYTIGEIVQAKAVKRARQNITSLLDVRPKIARVFRNGIYEEFSPEEVKIGEKIEVRVGEKIPLDGVLLSSKASVNSAAITGESKPMTVRENESVLAGSINLAEVIEIKSTKKFEDSSVSKILYLVQEASSRKAKTELLIRKLAKVYTPIVTYLAIAIALLPYFFVDNYIFSDWLYRALIFLVISCPCALVISIPLGYFGGLGAASKNGILFKGANYLEVFTQINTFVMDKTGTLTKGTFSIQKIENLTNFSEQDLMKYILAVEQKSNHPIAKALMEYEKDVVQLEAENVKEFSGKGMKATVEGKEVLIGNIRLMKDFDVEIPENLYEIVETIVCVAIDNKFAAYIIIADEYKENVASTIQRIKKLGIKNLYMLSGDTDNITQKVAKDLEIPNAKGGLLPEDKLAEINKLKQNKDLKIAFMGDGINDAPILAASDLGIAMGAMGSDLAIETADVVFQTDEPSKFITAYKISQSTKKIIWQNIALALGVKILVLVLGALGMASMWEAVFSDVGVALLAILNSVRLQKMKWN